MRSLFAVLLLLGTFAGPVAGQEKVLTLEQATRTALEKNLNIAQAQNNVTAAQSAVLAGYGRYLPTVSASGGWNRNQSEGPIYAQGVAIPGTSLKATSTTFSTGLNANYTIFDGFNREASLNRASATSVATEQTSARTRQSIVFQVESGYLNVLRREQLVRVSEENLKRDRRQLERITESNRVGALSLADVYRQQSQVAIDELSLINAQNDFDKAKADILALIGLDVFDEYRFADATVSTAIRRTEIDSVIALYTDRASLTRRALAARPDYLGAGENLRATESGVTSARANYFPSIGARAGMSLNNERLSDLTKYKNFNWGINLSWDLFDGFATNASIQNAIAQRRNAEIALAQAEINVAVDVKKALLDLEAAGKQLQVSEAAVQSATEDRKIAEERYNLGAGTLLDLLTASANFVNAEANKVNASYNYVIARRNVEYSLGERTY
jgi:outer membrane protein